LRAKVGVPLTRHRHVGAIFNPANILIGPQQR